MCGQIPSGLQAYSAATDSQGPQTLYSLDKCPPWIDSTAASDAGTAATGRSMNIGAVVGGVVGGCAFLALVAAAVLVAVMTRRRRRKRHDDLLTVPYRHSSIDGKVRCQVHPRTISHLFLLLCGTSDQHILVSFVQCSLICTAPWWHVQQRVQPENGRAPVLRTQSQAKMCALLQQVEALIGAQQLEQNAGRTRIHEGCSPATSAVQAPSSMGSVAQSSHSSGSGLAGQQSSSSSRGPPSGGSGGAMRSGSGGQSPSALKDGLAQLAQRDWELNLDALEVTRLLAWVLRLQQLERSGGMSQAASAQ